MKLLQKLFLSILSFLTIQGAVINTSILFLISQPVLLQAQQKKEFKEISKILVKGNRKIEEAAIRNQLKTRVGQILDMRTVREDVQRLFGMGFFYNVEVDQREEEGRLVVTYILTEKPIVAEIAFFGNDELDDDELNEAVAIKPYEILDITKIQGAIEKIQKLYEDKGFFLANVSYKLKDISTEEGVKAKSLQFDIVENDKVQVKKITFIGNKSLKDGYLKGRIQTQEGGLFSFMSGSGAYKQDQFDQDMKILNFLYFNEGYVQVKIDRPEVYVTPDKKSIYITIRIEEGEQFDVGEVNFTGDLLFSEKELYDAIQLDEGGTFISEKLQRDIQSLTAKYGDLGYAFTNVIPRTRIRAEERLVDITFEFDKGNKVYFGKINVKGNSKTRDKVIRRELQILEGELYNETKKRESIANIRRLGFFEEVNFNTSTPENSPDILNVDIVVKERNTGTIQIGAGFSSFSGFIFNGQVNQTNFLGKGQNLGVSIDLSERDSLFNLSFTEPHYNDSDWSIGFDAFRSVRDFIDRFEETKTGGAIRLGHPLAPYLKGFIQYKLDETEAELDEGADANLFPVETINGLTSSLKFTLSYDKRNDRFAPTKGIFSTAAIEYAGLGGDLEYTKFTSTFRYFKRLFWEVVWRNNLSYGLIVSNNDQDPPFNQLFLLGGANNLRGYDFFSIGRKKADSNGELQPFGGEQQIFLQTELEFPLIQEAGIKGVVFFDVGEAEDEFEFDELRSDVGFGFRWFSPIGPLRFEWGFPIAKRDGEKAVNFQFAIGSPF